MPVQHAKRVAALFLIVQLSGCLCASLNTIPNTDEKAASTNVVSDDSSPRALLESCEGVLNPTCLKLRFISLIDTFSKSEYMLFPGLYVTKESNEDKGKAMNELEEISRSFPDEPEKRVDSYLMYKIENFFETHSLKFKLIGDESARGMLDTYDDDDEDEADTKDKRTLRLRPGGALKRKKKKILGLIAAVVTIFKGLAGALSTGVIFFIAKKALVVGIAALVISVILAIKTFGGGGAGGLGDKDKDLSSYLPFGNKNNQQHNNHVDDYYPYARSMEFKLPEYLTKE